MQVGEELTSGEQQFPVFSPRLPTTSAFSFFFSYTLSPYLIRAGFVVDETQAPYLFTLNSISTIMKKLFSFALLMLCCIGLAQAQVKKQKLRVLYVGGATDQYPDTYKNDEAAMQADVKARTAAFEALLSTYFTEVKVMDAADYVQDCSKGYDVTVMDGRPKQTLRPAVRDRVKQAYAPAAYLTEDFDASHA